MNEKTKIIILTSLTVISSLLTISGFFGVDFNYLQRVRLTSEGQYIDTLTLRLLFTVIFFILTNLLIVQLYKTIYGFKIIKDGFTYVIEEIEKVAKKGGKIYTTALLENVEKGDEICKKLKNIKFEADVEFERFVFLTDPTLEQKWIREFLYLGEESPANKLITRVLKVKPVNRSVGAFIANSIPKFSISIFFRDNNKPYKVYLGFRAKKISSNFGISTSNRRVCKGIENLVSTYRDDAELIESSSGVTGYGYDYIGGVYTRIIEELRQVGYKNRDIEYIGVFGRHGMVRQKRIKTNEKPSLEGDLDLIVVLKDHVEPSDFKELMLDIVEYEKNISNKQISIEWSNMENKYYVRRKPIHIDIQLHKHKEDYYLTRPLLGFSIFDESLYTVYSEGNNSIDEFIEYPTDLLVEHERTQLALNTPEYGLKTAINRLGDSKYSDTDANRILWICLQNYVWAMTNSRIRTRNKVFHFIKTYKWFERIDKTLQKKIYEQYVNRNVNIDFEKSEVLNILKPLEFELENKLLVESTKI
ncbi:MAG: hypothetical protein WBB19_16385 [Desulforhopalus sp.]